MKQFRQFLLFKIAIPLVVFIFKLIALTYRMKEINTGKMTPRQGKEKQYIYGFFHSQLLPMIYFYRNTKMGSLASMSRDGEIAAVVAENFGITIIRGSSSRGGAAALMGMKSLFERGYDLALTVDGPRGPAGSVNNGVIFLGKLTGHEIIPACFCCSNSARLRSWDKLMIPLPFSKGYFNFGAPVAIPNDLADGDIPLYSEKIRKELERINKECSEALEK
jgi:lysophospholipid acyltransferase (LPLAT)-like uncharacterized protein